MPSFIAQPSYDTDASTFFTTAGVTRTDSKQQLSRFVIGIKDLGLWGNMVCWPLRSGQNAASGTTFYSLGGLGTFNGSLSGTSQTLGIGGIPFNGTNNVITTSFTSAGTSSFCGYAGTCPTAGGLGNFFGAANSNSQNIYWLNPRSGFGGEYRFSDSNISLADNALTGNHFWASRGVGGSPTRAYIDGSLVGTAVSSSTTPSPLTLTGGLAIGRGSGLYQGTIALAIVFTTDVSSPSSLHSLYKTTLGVGLDLP